MEQAYIIAAARTPVGSFQGHLSPVAATQLGATAIRAALNEVSINANEVEQCIMGQVLTAGAGQAPARQAALKAGLPPSVDCLTINKVCGSGLKAVMLAADSIQLGHCQIAIAGGQENMTQAPHLLKESRQGYRMGHIQAFDSMILDGLWDPYNDFHMGNAAELCAEKFNFSREEQDAFAIESYNRALNAQKEGYFKNEICPVTIEDRSGQKVINEDEEPSRVKFDKISSLRPAFDRNGTITAANASKINDGAAALVLMSGSQAKQVGKKPLVKIVAQATWSQEPMWFTTAPVGAIGAVLKKSNLDIKDVDLWEINEAFANVTMAAMKELSIPHHKVNVHGGAIAIGHPIGASGARILTTLIHALHTQEKRFGIATLCIGGGEAVALLVERPQ